MATRWHSSEDQLLRESMELSIKELPSVINALRQERGWTGSRTQGAIIKRLQKLGLRRRQPRTRWHPAEEQMLRESVDVSIDDLYTAINALRQEQGWTGYRTKTAIRDKSSDLGIKRRKEPRINAEVISAYVFDDLDLEIAVDKLPDAQKYVLVLYLMGYTQKEIGVKMDISRRVVNKKMTKAMENLRGWLR